MGSGDVILCTDHPILGQAVIVLHLDYPNCYESQDAFSSGHVECTSLPHRSDVFEFWPYPFKHCYPSPFLSNTGIRSCPIFIYIEIPALFFQTLVFRPCPFKHWNSHPIFINIGILALSIQTLVFQPHPFKHWNSRPIFINTGIPALSIKTLVFWPHPFKHWNSHPIFINIGILAPFFCEH